MQDQCTGHDLISKGPRNVSLSTRKKFPGSKERNGGYYDRGPMHHIVSCDIEARSRISTVPPPGTRSVSGYKVRSQDKGVDIAGKNGRLKRGPINQYHEILCCSRESRPGGSGESETGERGRGVTGDGARSRGMWDLRTHEPMLEDDELVEKGWGGKKREEML